MAKPKVPESPAKPVAKIPAEKLVAGIEPLAKSEAQYDAEVKATRTVKDPKDAWPPKPTDGMEGADDEPDAPEHVREVHRKAKAAERG